ncbi:hypothetical protein MK079_05650 [Candidatus Gracilibacteria bacterium]|nr:hypothetical protein [Candidatus Gracilibacteria bacterium]
MKFIITPFFLNQVQKLEKKYINISKDLESFEKNIESESSFSRLGKGLFKYRIKNSSIPVGKRGGFRIIVKVLDGKYLPLIIFPKTEKDNVKDIEIIQAFEAVIQQI